MSPALRRHSMRQQDCCAAEARASLDRTHITKAHALTPKDSHIIFLGDELLQLSGVDVFNEGFVLLFNLRVGLSVGRCVAQQEEREDHLLDHGCRFW